MTEQLSKYFYGNKKLLAHHAKQQSLTVDEVRQIFVPYSEKLASIVNTSKEITLLQIFAEFIITNIHFAVSKEFTFQKISSWVQIAAHVFQYSFENWLSKEESFSYFTEVLIRHSLFRPPKSVSVFNYEEVKVITRHWLNTFCRYYEEYRVCMSSQLQEALTSNIPTTQLTEREIVQGKVIQKTDFPKELASIVT